MNIRVLLAAALCAVLLCACQTEESKVCDEPEKATSSRPPVEVAADAATTPQHVLEPPAETPSADHQTTK